MNKVIVTGGRDYKDYAAVEEALNWARAEFDVLELVEGGARGADSLCRKYGRKHGMWVSTYKARWDLFGKRAGPLRNAAMVTQNADAKLLLAFPGGDGTANCTEMAASALIRCFQVGRDPDNKVTIREVVYT